MQSREQVSVCCVTFCGNGVFSPVNRTCAFHTCRLELDHAQYSDSHTFSVCDIPTERAGDPVYCHKHACSAFETVDGLQAKCDRLMCGAINIRATADRTTSWDVRLCKVHASQELVPQVKTVTIEEQSGNGVGGGKDEDKETDPTLEATGGGNSSDDDGDLVLDRAAGAREPTRYTRRTLARGVAKKKPTKRRQVKTMKKKIGGGDKR